MLTFSPAGCPLILSIIFFLGDFGLWQTRASSCCLLHEVAPKTWCNLLRKEPSILLLSLLFVRWRNFLLPPPPPTPPPPLYQVIVFEGVGSKGLLSSSALYTFLFYIRAMFLSSPSFVYLWMVSTLDRLIRAPIINCLPPHASSSTRPSPGPIRENDPDQQSLSS